MNRLISWLTWLYHQMLFLYPTAFHELYGEEMEEIFHQELRASINPLRIFGRELRDLPLALWRAHRRQRHLVVTSMGQLSPVERVAVRLRPWVWAMIIMLLVMAALYPIWLGGWADQFYYPEIPVLRGSSALILERDGKYARLPQSSYHCQAVLEKNRVNCTSLVGGEELRLSLWLSQGVNSFSGHCSGSYAGTSVNCLQLFVRARDYSMPPVSVEMPRALSDAAWQTLRQHYAFTFPASEWWFHWGAVISTIVSLAAAGVIWIASRATIRRLNEDKRWRRVFASTVAAAFCFLSMVWIALLFSLQLEEWFERF